MIDAEEAKMIALLDEQHKWPTLFAFKFIVPAENGSDLVALIPEATSTEMRPSSGGKYMAYTFHCPMGSAKEVLAVYAKVRGIKGMIAL